MSVIDFCGIAVIAIALVVSVAIIMEMLIHGAGYMVDILKDMTWNCRNHTKGRYEK